MSNNEEEPDGHILRRWFSIGDVLSAVAMLAALAASYGALSARLDSLSLDVQELRARDITPGARTELARIDQRDAAQDDALRELRAELRLQRAEILGALARVEQELQAHDREK